MDVKNKLTEVAQNEIWVEFGSPKQGEPVIAALYSGRGPGRGFDPKKDIFMTVTSDEARNTTVPRLIDKAFLALNWGSSESRAVSGKPMSPEERASAEKKMGSYVADKRAKLEPIMNHVLAVLRNPNEEKSKKYNRVFHIDVDDPATKDATVDMDTGETQVHPDKTSDTGLNPPTSTTPPPSTTPPVMGKSSIGKVLPIRKAGAKPIWQKEKLKTKAETIIKNLHKYLEINGVNPNDPNAMGAGPEGTELPIQKKKSDILSNTDITSDPDEDNDAEDTIAADTTNQAVIAFERWNPVTRRNLEGLRDFEKTVKKEGGDGFIFISQVEPEQEQTDQTDVLTYDEVVIFLKKVIDERNIKSELVNDVNIETITDVATYLASEGYKSLVICTTADKLGEYKNEIDRKNNKPTESGTFAFSAIEVRKIVAIDTSEMKDLNNAVLDGDFAIFLKHIGTGDISFAKKIYLKMRQAAL